MRRSAVVAAAVLTAGLAAGPVAHAAPACSIHKLPLPAGGVAGSVNGSSPDGLNLVGYARTAVSPPDGAAMVWRDGAIAATVPHAPGPLVDMNSAGDGVGDSVDDQNRHHPWFFHDATVRALSGEGTAYAIGEEGQLVGSMLADTTDGPPIAVPAVWPQDAQVPVPLKLPGRETGVAHDIGADDTIVGTVGTVGTDAYVWHPDGTGTVLPRPPGVGDQETVTAESIDGPWVTGSAPGVGAVRWNLTTDTVETVPGLDALGPHRVNGTGAVVGSNGYAAVAVADGHPVTLPALGKDYLNHPASLDAGATVFGGTTQPNANPSPVTEIPVSWTCG